MPSIRPRLPLLLALLLLLLAGLAWQQWQRFLVEQGVVQLDWQGSALSLDGVHVEHLTLRRELDGKRLDVLGEQLRMEWPRRVDGHWRLGPLSLDRLRISAWQAAPGTLAPGTGLHPEQLANWLGLLPQSIVLARLELELPCPGAPICRLNGRFVWRQLPDGAATLSAELHQGSGRLSLNGELRRQDANWQLNLNGDIDDQRLADLQAEWLPAGRQWRGSLASPGVPPLGAVRTWLAPWLPTPTLPLSLPEAGRLRLTWDTVLAGDSPWPDWPGLRDSRGSLDLNMQLPQPWPLPGVGGLQGDLQLQAAAEQPGRWRPRILSGDLYLADLYGYWLQALPVGLRPATLRVEMQPEEGSVPAVRIDARIKGASTARLRGVLALRDGEPPSLELRDGKLQGQVPSLQLGDLRLAGGVLDLPLEGELGSSATTLRLGRDAQLRLASLSGIAGISSTKVSAKINSASLQLGYAGQDPLSYSFAGPVRLEIGNLRQAHLKPLGWTYQGDLNASQLEQGAKGKLQNTGGLVADIVLHRAADGGLQLNAQMPEVALGGGNPLAASLADWPALLGLDNGRLQGRLDWSLPAGKAQQLDLQLSAKGLEGVYDRSEVHGADASAQVKLRGDALTVQLPALRIERLNPGVALGPLQLQGRYGATLGKPLGGRLDWQQAELRLFGGRAWLEPGGLELAQDNAPQSLHLEGVLLEEVLKAYPAEGLAGNGIIDGELPLHIAPGGLSIQGGKLAARQPGFLQFRSEKIRTLGSNNPAMQLVATALDDFRYQQLGSSLDYAQDGRLRLGLSLSGQNPALEQGRPINLNVNLEENIPALMTSLQLSDRVSEIIRKRVQERLRKNPSAAP
ncbi:intermembrane phospholipid transport protein YdbH family protein [Pseudomonas knackmussii]|uniref:intermembrane phospholipid transport protein YdbH family protein n=1 Tax=Pseudomonas knackmussii TaxID=65741 RepID=UPI003BE7E9AF